MLKINDHISQHDLRERLQIQSIVFKNNVCRKPKKPRDFLKILILVKLWKKQLNFQD